MTEKHHPLVALARQTIDAYVRNRTRLEVPTCLTPDMSQRAGAFVSLHKHGALRGCIGTIEPHSDNVAQEVMANAIQAATQDPRFPAVGVGELAELEVSVDVLQPPEPVASLEQLDPKRFGVIVQTGWRRGLLLPDLEGIDTAADQVQIARRKAGIDPHEPVQLYRFEVTRYH